MLEKMSGQENYNPVFFHFQHLENPYTVRLIPAHQEGARVIPDTLEVWDNELCGQVSGDLKVTPENRQFTVIRSDNFRDTHKFPKYRRLMRVMIREIVSKGMINTWISDQLSSMSHEAQHAYEDLLSQSKRSDTKFTIRLDPDADRYILRTK